MLPLIAGAATATGIGVVSYGVGGRSAQVFGPSVYRGPGKRKSIALTFDDGPSEGTLPLLEYLAKHNIRATFFQCGMNIVRLSANARAVHAAEHEIGNHTYSHARLCPRFSRKMNFRSPANILGEFAQAQHIIETEVGVKPTLLRAPFGMRWYGIGAAQRQLGLLGVMWTVIGHDWEWPASRVTEHVLKAATPGGIVCLHDGRDIQAGPDTSEMLHAVRRIVPVLQDRGYSFETVSDLLLPNPQFL